MKAKKKKISIKSVVKKYAEEKTVSYYATMITSAIGGCMAILPYYFIWRIVSILIKDGNNVDMEQITLYASYIFITQMVAIITNFSSGIISHYMAFRVEKNIRRDAIKHIMNLPMGFFENEDSGRLRRMIDDNASKTHTFIAHVFPDMASAFVAPILLLIFIIVTDYRFGILCVLSIVMGILSMSTMMGKKSRALMDEYMKSSENMSIDGVEFIRGMPVVKVFNQSVESFQHFYNSIMKYDKEAKFFVNFCRTPMIIYTLCLFAPTILIGPLGMILIGRTSSPLLLLTDSIFYIIISMLLHSTFMRFATISEFVNLFRLAIEKLDSIFAVKPAEIADIETNSKEGIFFDKVEFTYEGKTVPAVSDFSFHFEKGKSYALVGLSGSGKTTVLSLIGRFYDVQKGSISIDGQDVKSMSEAELMDKLAIVFQENKLMRRTIKENIDMGFNAGDDEIEKAIDDSRSRDILERMDKGIDTMIGEKGTYLSGGEAQRIAIARALLRNREILLLDEATAFADPENEKKIQKSIDNLKIGKTCIMIAHRLSAIKDVDKILVMKKGRLIAEGSHEELMKNCDYYNKLFENYSRSVKWRVANG